MRRSVLNDVSSLKKIMAKIEVHVSCLSCSQVFAECFMLTCGHSICEECMHKHSDPKSKEAIVFCEECKQETKNRQLTKSLEFLSGQRQRSYFF